MSNPYSMEQFKAWMHKKFPIDNSIGYAGGPRNTTFEVPEKELNEIFNHLHAVISVDVEEELKNPIYCERCGSCGEAGCCDPDNCETVRLFRASERLKAELREKEVVLINLPQFDALLAKLQESYRCGLYCETNVDSYSQMSHELNNALYILDQLKKYFTSGNDIPVDKATIKADDFWRLLQKVDEF